jgi:hypothetical protein
MILTRQWQATAPALWNKPEGPLPDCQGSREGTDDLVALKPGCTNWHPASRAENKKRLCPITRNCMKEILVIPADAAALRSNQPQPTLLISKNYNPTSMFSSSRDTNRIRGHTRVFLIQTVARYAPARLKVHLRSRMLLPKIEAHFVQN